MINFNRKSPMFLRIFMCVLFLCVAGVGFAAYAEESTAGRYVTMINAFLSGTGGFCWFCPMFSALFDAMNTLATAVSTKLSQVFLMVMGVGLLFSIAFKVGKMVTQLQPVELMQFLTDLFKHLGRAIIAAALLGTSLSIFTYLVSPILSLSMNLTMIITDEGGMRGSIVTALQDTPELKDRVKIESMCDEYKEAMKIEPGPVSKQTKAFTDDSKASMLCALKTMSSSLLFGIVLGSCIYVMTWLDMIWGILPNFMYAVLGVVLILAHLAILVSFPFKLIDAMVRMAFVCALMPLWIILWVFPATVGYTKKAWDMFVSSCLIFVCMSVVITLAMTLMTAALGNREALNKLLVKDEFSAAAHLISLGSKEFFVSVALCYMAFKMLGTATTLANSFTGSMPDLGMGQAAQQFGAQTVKLGGGLAAAGGRKAMDAVGISTEGIGTVAGRVGMGVATFGGSELTMLGGKAGLWGAGKAANITKKATKAAARGTWKGTKKASSATWGGIKSMFGGGNTPDNGQNGADDNQMPNTSGVPNMPAPKAPNIPGNTQQAGATGVSMNAGITGSAGTAGIAGVVGASGSTGAAGGADSKAQANFGQFGSSAGNTAGGASGGGSNAGANKADDKNKANLDKSKDSKQNENNKDNQSDQALDSAKRALKEAGDAREQAMKFEESVKTTDEKATRSQTAADMAQSTGTNAQTAADTANNQAGTIQSDLSTVKTQVDGVKTVSDEAKALAEKQNKPGS